MPMVRRNLARHPRARGGFWGPDVSRKDRDRVIADRIARADHRPHPDIPGSRIADDALLYNPAQNITEAQRKRLQEIQDALDHSAAVQMCDRVITEGCEGKGCTSPDHFSHVGAVIYLWQALGLTDKGKLAERFREAS